MAVAHLQAWDHVEETDEQQDAPIRVHALLVKLEIALRALAVRLTRGPR